MTDESNPVFALQSVPGWEHGRVESAGAWDDHDEWRDGRGNRVELYDDGGFAVVTVDNFLTAEQARQLTTLFAMIAAELERRERAAWCGNPDCHCKEAPR